MKMTNNYGFRKDEFFVPGSLLCDFYKVSHRPQYPKGTETVYATWTPRTSRIDGVDHVVAFGLQGFCIEFLINYFNKYFFGRPEVSVVAEYKRVIKHCLGVDNPDADHIAGLHRLGYLPLLIKAVPEGTLVPIRCPMATIENTDKRFFWVTNYIETLMSDSIWLPTTSATMALEFRKLLTRYAKETDADNVGFVQFQGHDFSMRGMGCLNAAMTSGAGHLTAFVGTDTIPAITNLEYYYGADIEKELVGTSIPATEHSVAEAYGQDNESEYYMRMLKEVYPKGFVSIVSDTWNLWMVLDVIIRGLKDVILTRDGKCVIRPDSGDPVKIVCGDPGGTTEFERKGVVEILWDIFGGTINAQGYKVLDPHIGCIYGDAITWSRCFQICDKLKAKGFASTNMVYGIGSFTYQYVTRDTFGFALKTTYCVCNGEERILWKDPITDKGIKKSQRGRVVVLRDSCGHIYYKDGLLAQDEAKYDNVLQEVFYNGNVTVEDLASIRDRITKSI
jgi:nicotinamide phosphoribosyltransferase